LRYVNRFLTAITSQRNRQMMKTFSFLVAGAALLALTGVAQAAQPLTNAQMDSVTAGGFATANAVSNTLGEIAGDTVALTSTNVSTVPVVVSTASGPVTVPPIAIGESYSQALAAGGVNFQVFAISHADSAASLP
jgi:ABC-type proline/glycine betaine transport system substrate-binding protein